MMPEVHETGGVQGALVERVGTRSEEEQVTDGAFLGDDL